MSVCFEGTFPAAHAMMALFQLPDRELVEPFTPTRLLLPRQFHHIAAHSVPTTEENRILLANLTQAVLSITANTEITAEESYELADLDSSRAVNIQRVEQSHDLCVGNHI